MQINDTVAPLARAVNISEENIRVDSYENITWSTTRRRLEVSGFLIDYLIQVLQDDEATELVEVITAENFSNAFIEELAFEFNISTKNFIVESIAAKSSVGSSSSSSRDSWIEVAWVLLFFFVLMFFVGAVGFIVRKRSHKGEHHLLEKENSEEPRTPKGNKRRRRSRRSSKMSEKKLVEEAGDMRIVEDSKQPVEDTVSKETTISERKSIPEAGGEVSLIPLPRGSTITPEESHGLSNTLRKNPTSDQTDRAQQALNFSTLKGEAGQKAKVSKNAPSETELVQPKPLNSNPQQDEDDGDNGSSLNIDSIKSEVSSSKENLRNRGLKRQSSMIEV